MNGRIEIWKCRFSLWREENRSTRKKPSEQGREPTTNSTHIRHHFRESNPGHNGGRRVLSPLRHPCSPKLTSRGWKTVMEKICSKIYSREKERVLYQFTSKTKVGSTLHKIKPQQLSFKSDRQTSKMYD